MYADFIGEKITIVVASRGENLLEYTGTLILESDETVELTNVEISYLVLNFQKGIFGGDINKYKSNLQK